jgi:hypothetical protein
MNLRQAVFASAFLATSMIVSELAWGAAGWTGRGSIITLEQDPSSTGARVYVSISVASNPNGCSVSNGFYFSVTDDRTKRLFAMLMSAQAASQIVAVYVTGNCTGGYGEMDGVSSD